jgi:uncharacterized protein
VKTADDSRRQPRSPFNPKIYQQVDPRATPPNGHAGSPGIARKSEERMDVRNNESASRYELEVDRGMAVATYRLKRNVITFIHTEVPPNIRRQGIAARLIAGALTDVRARGWKFRTICPFVASYIEHHPEVRDLLAGGEA